MKQILFVKRHAGRLVLGLLVVLGLFWVNPVGAQGGYPDYDGIFVNDYANLINSDDALYLQQVLGTLMEETGVEMTVLTIGSFLDYDTGDGTFEDFATNLFNTWGVGNAGTNDGIMLLVAIDDRLVRIETGTSYENQYQSGLEGIIDNEILPAFRAGNFSEGIVAGTDSTIALLVGELDNAPQLPPPTPRPIEVITIDEPPPSASFSMPDVSTGAVAAGGAGGLGALAYAFSQFRRYRKRKCRHCGSDMHRLDEHADDAYLNDGQQMEEFLKSVDYDVWRCPTCEHHTLKPYKAWLSGFKRCTSCHYHTMNESKNTIHHATCDSSGTARVTQNCRHCHYQNQYTVTIPQRNCDDSSSSGGSSFSGGSSSSSSFGGGSSSGGGASGSW